MRRLMLKYGCLLVVSVSAASTFVGCNGVNEARIKVDASNDPLEQPRSLLKKYADGQALGSEATMFSGLVEAVKKADPKRGEILEAGFKQLQDAPEDQRSEIAKELLQKIQPSMTRS
jgi:hypothetical protein